MHQNKVLVTEWHSPRFDAQQALMCISEALLSCVFLSCMPSGLLRPMLACAYGDLVTHCK